MYILFQYSYILYIIYTSTSAVAGQLQSKETRAHITFQKRAYRQARVWRKMLKRFSSKSWKIVSQATLLYNTCIKCAVEFVWEQLTGCKSETRKKMGSKGRKGMILFSYAVLRYCTEVSRKQAAASSSSSVPVENPSGIFKRPVAYFQYQLGTLKFIVCRVTLGILKARN